MSKKKYIFIYQGEFLETHSLVEIKMESTQDEWDQITSETVKEKCFIEVLKDIAQPLLHEEWTRDQEISLRGLRRAVKAIKEIDPLRIAQFDQKTLKDEYTARSLKGIQELQDIMKESTGREAVAGDGPISISQL